MNEFIPKNNKQQLNFKTVHGLPQSIHSSQSKFSIDEGDEEDEDIKVKEISEISDSSKVHFGFLENRSKSHLSSTSTRLSNYTDSNRQNSF